MDITTTIALSLGIAWASGINLYAAVFMLGFMGTNGHIDLPPDLLVLQDPAVMMAAGFMYCVEFFADKTPGVDSGWDAIHSFIRIPAGAVMASMAVGDVSPAMQVAAFLVGGAVTTTSHATKAGSRVLINTSPEPFSNWVASVAEDIIVIGGLWTALYNPVLFLILLGVFIVLMIWLLPKIWRGIKLVARKLGALFSKFKEPDNDKHSPDPENINTSELGSPPKDTLS
jgi:hypothetical protein